MHEIISPTGIAPPSSNYALAALVKGAGKWLHISGQVGVLPDGTLPPGSEGQMRECWRKISVILAEAGMSTGNIVKVTAFLTDPNDVALYRKVRDESLGGHTAASTLLIVAGLANPDWTVEIEVVAAV